MSPFTEDIRLNGVNLHKYLRVPDWVSAKSVAGSERRTFGGLAVQRYVLSAKDTLTLTAEYSGNKLYGYFIHSQYEQFVALRDAGTPVDFVHHGTTTRVVIPLEGVNLLPIIRLTNPPADHRYYGTLTLRGVAA